MKSYSRLRNRLLSAGLLMDVASIAVFNNGRLLMGVRRDTGLWTLPGGHANPGEDIFTAALRELYEETGISATKDQLIHLRTDEVKGRTGGMVRIHAFRIETASVPTTKKDPDREVYFWDWIDVSQGLMTSIRSALHSKKNVVLEALGLLG